MKSFAGHWISYNLAPNDDDDISYDVLCGLKKKNGTLVYAVANNEDIENLMQTPGISCLVVSEQYEFIKNFSNSLESVKKNSKKRKQLIKNYREKLSGLDDVRMIDLTSPDVSNVKYHGETTEGTENLFAQEEEERKAMLDAGGQILFGDLVKLKNSNKGPFLVEKLIDNDGNEVESLWINSENHNCTVFLKHFLEPVDIDESFELSEIELVEPDIDKYLLLNETVILDPGGIIDELLNINTREKVKIIEIIGEDATSGDSLIKRFPYEYAEYFEAAVELIQRSGDQIVNVNAEYLNPLKNENEEVLKVNDVVAFAPDPDKYSNIERGKILRIWKEDVEAPITTEINEVYLAEKNSYEYDIQLMDEDNDEENIVVLEGGDTEEDSDDKLEDAEESEIFEKIPGEYIQGFWREAGEENISEFADEDTKSLDSKEYRVRQMKRDLESPPRLFSKKDFLEPKTPTYKPTIKEIREGMYEATGHFHTTMQIQQILKTLGDEVDSELIEKLQRGDDDALNTILMMYDDKMQQTKETQEEEESDKYKNREYAAKSPDFLSFHCSCIGEVNDKNISQFITEIEDTLNDYQLYEDNNEVEIGIATSDVPALRNIAMKYDMDCEQV